MRQHVRPQKGIQGQQPALASTSAVSSHIGHISEAAEFARGGNPSPVVIRLVYRREWGSASAVFFSVSSCSSAVFFWDSRDGADDFRW